MDTSRFWPLDFDPEDEIYENVAWDLPGYRRNCRNPGQRRKASMQSMPASPANSAKSRVQSP